MFIHSSLLCGKIPQKNTPNCHHIFYFAHPLVATCAATPQVPAPHFGNPWMTWSPTGLILAVEWRVPPAGVCVRLSVPCHCAWTHIQITRTSATHWVTGAQTFTIAAATNYGKLLTRSYWLVAQRSRTSETQGLKWAAASVLGINEPDATVVQRHITPLLLITAVAVTLDQHGCNMCVFLHIKNL